MHRRQQSPGEVEMETMDELKARGNGAVRVLSAHEQSIPWHRRRTYSPGLASAAMQMKAGR